MPGDLSDPSYTKSRRDGARGMQKQSHQFVLMKFFLRTSESRSLERVVVASRALMVNCADQECEQEAHMRVCVCVCVWQQCVSQVQSRTATLHHTQLDRLSRHPAAFRDFDSLDGINPLSVT